MVKISPVFRQFITIICCNLLTLAYGLSDGWVTINFIEMQSENTTLSTGPLTSDQMPLIISISNVGGILGNFLIVPISRAIGIKSSIHILGLPLILATVLVIWAQNINYLYISRFLGGLTGGASLVSIPIFINYISLDNVRGALNSICDPAYNLGIIASYIFGNVMSCLDQAKIQLIIPMIFMGVLFLFPESSEFWISRNDQCRANKARQFYKGKEKNEPEAAEFLSESSNERNNNFNSNSDNVLAKKPVESTTSAWKHFKSPHARKAFFVVFASMNIGFFAGIWFMQTYVTDIFDKTGSTFSPKNSSILISVVTLITNLLFSNIVERFNRKTLYAFSAVFTSLSYFVFAFYCQFLLKRPEYEWLPPLCFTCIIFFSGLGLLPIPYTIMTEIFPKEIREISLAICVSVAWLDLFILGYIFPMVLAKIGYSASFTIFGCACLFKTIFGLIFYPETRGKSYDEIKEIMTKS